VQLLKTVYKNSIATILILQYMRIVSHPSTIRILRSTY